MTNHKSHHIFIYLGLLIGIFILFFGFNYFKSLYNFNETKVVVSDQDYNTGALTESPFVPKETEGMDDVDSFIGGAEYPELPTSPLSISDCARFVSEYSCQEGFEGNIDCNPTYSRTAVRCQALLDGKEDPYGEDFSTKFELLLKKEANSIINELWYQGVTNESYQDQPALITDSIVFKELEYGDAGPTRFYQYITVDHNQKYIDPIYGVPAYKNENTKKRYYLLDTKYLESYDYRSSQKDNLYDFRNIQVMIDVEDGVVKRIVAPYQS